MNLKRFVLLALVTVAVLSVFAAPATARSTKTVFTAELLTPYDVGAPEREWIDGGSTLHARGQSSKRDITGDIVGWEAVEGNINLNLETLDGQAWGEVTLYVTWKGREGTFEAHYSMQITDGYADGRVVGHGTGELEGVKLMAHVFDVDPPPGIHLMVLEGVLLDPHGD